MVYTYIEFERYITTATQLCPYFDRTVPASGGKAGPIGRHSQRGHSIVVPVQHGDPRRFQRVPYIDAVIIVASKQYSPRAAKVHGVGTEKDRFLVISGNLSIRPEVKETTGAVITAGANAITTRVIADTINVRIVTIKVLNIVASAHVPHKGILVARLQ